MNLRPLPLLLFAFVFPAFAHAAPAAALSAPPAAAQTMSSAAPAPALTVMSSSFAYATPAAPEVVSPVQTIAAPVEAAPQTAEVAAATLTSGDDALVSALVEICAEEGVQSDDCRNFTLEYASYQGDFSLSLEPDDKPVQSLTLLLLVAKVKLAVIDQTAPKKTDANKEFEEHVKDILKLALGGDKDARQALIDLSKEDLKNVDPKKLISDILKGVKDDKGTSDKDKETIDGILKDIGSKK